MSTSHDTTSPSQRWTPARIRKLQRSAVSLADQHMTLAWLAEHGDLLDPTVPLPYDCAYGAVRWMLVPVSAAVIRVLAMFGVERSDLEDGADTEESGDEHEPELGSTQQTDQERGWGAPKVRGRPSRLLPAFNREDHDEPSLGSVGSCVTADCADQEQWSHHCGGPLDAELDTTDDEPSLGTTNGIDQSDWQGTTSDLELDDSDYEPDDRGDLSFGATTPDEIPPRHVRRPRARLPVHAAEE